MIKLSLDQKISFLKIVFSFMNMDSAFSDDEEKALEILKNNTFNISIQDSQYRTAIKNINELKKEFYNLNFETQNKLLIILNEIVAKNKYEDSGFFKKSKKEKESNELLEQLVKSQKQE